MFALSQPAYSFPQLFKCSAHSLSYFLIKFDLLKVFSCLRVWCCFEWNSKFDFFSFYFWQLYLSYWFQPLLAKSLSVLIRHSSECFYHLSNTFYLKLFTNLASNSNLQLMRVSKILGYLFLLSRGLSRQL